MSRARAEALMAWYRSQERDIPWRESADPYLVLVGEVMTQQTQAARAVAHYRRFVARYRSAAELAAAPLADVLRMWAGLGYNSRAQRLRDAARHIVRHGWPADLEELPGVGPYTAAAVSSLAFGAQVAVVDTNVRRVLGRWRGRSVDSDAADEAARQLHGPAAEWNQALMDLGATICRGRSPDCGVCPVAEWCVGPEAYEPPPRQSRYQGSLRQARSAVLLHVAEKGPRSRRDVAGAVGMSTSRVDEAVGALVADGLLAEDGDRLVVAG